jgi:hypothetical protein
VMVFVLRLSCTVLALYFFVLSTILIVILQDDILWRVDFTYWSEEEYEYRLKFLSLGVAINN